MTIIFRSGSVSHFDTPTGNPWTSHQPSGVRRGKGQKSTFHPSERRAFFNFFLDNSAKSPRNMVKYN